jgi:hypothetical protein
MEGSAESVGAEPVVDAVQSPPNCYSTLPRDVLLGIFMRLDSISLYRVGQVCSKWRKVALEEEVRFTRIAHALVSRQCASAIPTLLFSAHFFSCICSCGKISSAIWGPRLPPLSGNLTDKYGTSNTFVSRAVRLYANFVFVFSSLAGRTVLQTYSWSYPCCSYGIE